MEEPRSTITVLYAEDDLDDQFLLKEAWEENNILNPLQIVNDGTEVIDYLKNKGEYVDSEKYPLPGLILLDLNMPKMNGAETLEKIKNDKDLKNIPVIVLTTSKAEEDIISSYDLGVNSFITKPVSFEGLIKMVSVFNKYWFQIVELSQ
ncbi:MAG: response regulator [Ignavibacteriae bacterium]|nr:response regulator [Ignavibacteriota bacterium]